MLYEEFQMKVEEFLLDQFMHMDPMHDSYATEIKVENKCLIIIYDKLDEGVLGEDSTPYCKNKKLTIKYDFKSYCDAKIYYSKNKFMDLDITDNLKAFNKITNNCLFMSYKYSVDSFGELSLGFSIRKIVNNTQLNYKYWGLDIELDAEKITYIWE